MRERAHWSSVSRGGRRRKIREDLKELDDAQGEASEDALKEAVAIDVQSGTPDDGRGIVDALDALSGFFQREGTRRHWLRPLQTAIRSFSSCRPNIRSKYSP